MLLLDSVVGHREAPDIRERLHRLFHEQRVETIQVSESDAPRRRFRATTDKGRDCAVALPRATQLNDGDILLLQEDLAIIFRIGAQRWLRLKPKDPPTALKLGYHAGNLHWRVRFDGTDLLIAVDQPIGTYTDLLHAFLEEKSVDIADDP